MMLLGVIKVQNQIFQKQDWKIAVQIVCAVSLGKMQGKQVNKDYKP